MTMLTETELAVVAAAMAKAGEQPAGRLTAELISGGRSNLTFGLTDGTRHWVLRTPPRTGRTPSAHDVIRESRIIAGLRDSAVPVPRPVVAVANEDLLGGPFAVTERVPGKVVRTSADLEDIDDGSLDTAIQQLVATLVSIHRVDLDAVGLADLGRQDGYAERQLRRWAAQWELVGTEDDDALARELLGILTALPIPSSRAALVHGDYRIDNVIFDLDGEMPAVAAVLDWELATLGDPVADVAMMTAYREPAFELIINGSAWTDARIPAADHLAAAYEMAGGVPLRQWEFHRALACFKIAVIAAGITHRAHAGSGVAAGEAVGAYLEMGRDVLRRS